MKPVMNFDEAAFDDIEENGHYTSKRASIGIHIGAQKLGYNLTVVPPGKVQCPFHNHRGEEEMFFILEGEGELHFGDKRYPLRPNDITLDRLLPQQSKKPAEMLPTSCTKIPLTSTQNDG